MSTVLDTLITRFGFETDKTGLDKAEKGLSDFKASALKIAASVGAILGGSFFLNAIANTADETLKWADANGVVIESLGELEFAAQRQGGTIEGLRSSLSNMNKSIGEVQRGTGRAKLAFEDYDLSIKKADGSIKTADELLVDLNKKFSTLSRAQQFDLAMKMGIDKGTIRLLQTAPDEIARLRIEASKLGVLARQDAVKAAEFVDGMTNIAQAINAIKYEVAGLFFKPLADFFKLIASGISFFRRHKEILLSIIGILSAVAASYVAMGIKAAAAWLLAFAPFTAVPLIIGAASIALAILMEDLFAFFSGSQSAIGDFLKNFPKIETAFRVFGDFLGFLLFKTVEGFEIWWSWLSRIGQGIINFLFSPIQSTIDIFTSLSDASISSFSTILSWLTKIGAGIAKFFLNPLDSAMDLFNKMPGLDRLGSLLGFDRPENGNGNQDQGQSGKPGQPGQSGKPFISENRRNDQGQSFSQDAPIVGAISPASPILTRSDRVVKQSTTLKVGDINVDARGGDSKEIAQNVNTELSNQLKNTVEDFDSIIEK